MRSLFIWPDPKPFELRHFIGSRVTTDEIEEQLRHYFPSAEPVLFSSARGGLSTILAHLGLTRPDLVWCPPFSSHCVFESIARVATPTTLPHPNAKVALTYHQWGHVVQNTFSPDTTIIEDAVDTLFAPGSNPFATGGRFALWSLPKTIASHCGGVVFCRLAEDAQALRRLRASNTMSGTVQALLRIIGEKHPSFHLCWRGIEGTSNTLPTFVLRQIRTCLEDLPHEVTARRQRLAELAPFSLAPPPPENRLPCCLPLTAELLPAGPLPSGHELIAGLRSFNIAVTAPNVSWRRVFPAPIHQDTDGTHIADFVAKIYSQPRISLNESGIVR